MDGGHRRIALITGPLDTPSGRFRLDGFRDELGDRFDGDLVEVVPFTREAGAEAMTRLLERAPDVDAVFAASDLLAVGAAQTLAAQGRRIPQDIALAGIADIPITRYVTPALTTVRVRIADFGRLALERLADVVERPGQETPSADTLGFEIVVRDTCGGNKPEKNS